jgi:hypothetical protein
MILSVTPRVLDKVITQAHKPYAPGAQHHRRAGIHRHRGRPANPQYKKSALMPNTPGARKWSGITVWTATHEVPEMQACASSRHLNTLGQEIYVEDEDYLTWRRRSAAQSGVCVPVHGGADRCKHSHALQEQLVIQTMRVDRSNMPPSAKSIRFWSLCNQATSPGGTPKRKRHLERGVV